MVAMMTCTVGGATGMQLSERGSSVYTVFKQVLQQRAKKTDLEHALCPGCNYDLLGKHGFHWSPKMSHKRNITAHCTS